MIITDLHQLNVGDWFRITHKELQHVYCYNVVKIMYNTSFLYITIRCPYRKIEAVGLQRDVLDDFNMQTMSEEEITAYIINGNPY